MAPASAICVSLLLQVVAKILADLRATAAAAELAATEAAAAMATATATATVRRDHEMPSEYVATEKDVGTMDHGVQGAG